MGDFAAKRTMAYTVKQVAAMSGVSVRTLHFYDEAGLLAPAYHGANGYRFYEEPQLLILQQILFYRELGFELKQIKGILGQPDFEKAAALQSHRVLLLESLDRTGRLIETIDKTLGHLKGTLTMKSEEMFEGFSVAAGDDRFDEHVKIGGEANDCKVSGRDTGGAMCVFEFTGSNSGPRHRHPGQDEWIYIIEGQFMFEVGERHFQLGAGESVFLPRNVAHAWTVLDGQPGKIVNVYQPAGAMEDFFREIGKYSSPAIHEALSFDELRQLFVDHGVEMAGPPLTGGWRVDEAGRIIGP